MKRFMLAILSIVFCASAFGDCETITTGKWKFGCDSTDNGANEDYEYNTFVQTVGASHCHDQKGLKYNKQWRCEDTQGTSDDQWQESGENWCSDTKFKNAEVPGALYSVYKNKSLCAGPVEYNSESNSNGCAGGCLYAACPSGLEYDSVNEACIPTDKNAYCKESSVRHPDAMSDALKELPTGSNTYLYCYTGMEFAKITEANKKRNSCLAWKSSVIVDNVYYECTDKGWDKREWNKCSTSDFNNCDNIDNCVSELVDSSTNKKILNAGGTAQEAIFDSNTTFCVRYVCAEGYTKVDEKTCKANSAINKERIDQANQNVRRSKCADSGGTWSGGKCKCDTAKNLRLFNGECVCTNENYKHSGDQCVLTNTAQEKKDCEAAETSGAYWQDNECKCVDPQNEWRNKKCQLRTDIAECNKITGAHWVNNECKCINNNQEINAERTKCVMSASFTATQTVNNVYSKLTSIHNKFRDDVSVWKDSEGKFNTARLASDSIAGVVLGTTGALVTSHVVKKNQVEYGFEDIKCTIGGQNVAEWGDQFRVGIQ